MAEQEYFINPDAIVREETMVYDAAFNAALTGLIGKRSWGWLNNPANHDELVDLAITIALNAAQKNIVLFRLLDKGYVGPTP